MFKLMLDLCSKHIYCTSIQYIEDLKMLPIKNHKISTLNINKQEAVNDPTLWLNVKELSNENLLAEQYSKIYSQYQVKNKWILMINPENNSFDNMQNIPKENLSRILRVHSNKVNVKIENIETALLKGNCSAVILNNTSFNSEELAQLYKSAKKGNTQCIILNNKISIH